MKGALANGSYFVLSLIRYIEKVQRQKDLWLTSAATYRTTLVDIGTLKLALQFVGDLLQDAGGFFDLFFG